jgi:hypothetical protein
MTCHFAFRTDMCKSTAGSWTPFRTIEIITNLPSHATTPINVDLLEYELCNHPDNNFVSYLCTGLRHGFDTLVQSERSTN